MIEVRDRCFPTTCTSTSCTSTSCCCCALGMGRLETRCQVALLVPAATHGLGGSARLIFSTFSQHVLLRVASSSTLPASYSLIVGVVLAAVVTLYGALLKLGKLEISGRVL